MSLNQKNYKEINHSFQIFLLKTTLRILKRNTLATPEKKKTVLKIKSLSKLIIPKKKTVLKIKSLRKLKEDAHHALRHPSL